MQTVRLSAPLLGLVLLAVLSLSSAASIGVKEERLPGGPPGGPPGGGQRVCVQDDKGNLVCGKVVVGPGSPAPLVPPPMMDFLLPPMPPKFHEVRDHGHDRSAESRMLLPFDLFSLPSLLGDFSDESLSFPLDDIMREMGKAHSCAPVPGQVMSDGKLIMDCVMAGDDLPGPVSMHVTYDLSDLPDDFSIRDLVSPRRGMDMLLPPPLWQMMADLMPSQSAALPLLPPPTKMAPPPTPTPAPAPTQQLEKADKDKSKLDPFHEQMNEIRSSFDAVLRDAMEKPALTPGPVSGSGSGPAMHLSIDGDVSVLGTPSPNNKQIKFGI